MWSLTGSWGLSGVSAQLLLVAQEPAPRTSLAGHLLAVLPAWRPTPWPPRPAPASQGRTVGKRIPVGARVGRAPGASISPPPTPAVCPGCEGAPHFLALHSLLLWPRVAFLRPHPLRRPHQRPLQPSCPGATCLKPRGQGGTLERELGGKPSLVEPPRPDLER